MRAMRVTGNEKSYRVPIDLSELNNLDFNGDELWFYVPGSEEAVREVEATMARVWGRGRGESHTVRLRREVSLAGGVTGVDSAMYIKMPLEDMTTHPGVGMYEAAMLKPRSWRVIGMTITDPTYWRS